MLNWASQVALVRKNSPADTGDVRDWHSIPGLGISPGLGWHPTPVFLPEKFHGQRSPGGQQSMMPQRIKHNWAHTPPYLTRDYRNKTYILKVKDLWNEWTWEAINRMGKTKVLFKKIRDTKGTLHALMGTVKDRNGTDLTEAEDIKKRW